MRGVHPHSLPPLFSFFLSFFLSFFTRTQSSTSLLPSFPPSRFPLAPPPPPPKKKKKKKKTDTCKSPNLESVDTRRVADTLHSSRVPVGKSTRTGSASANSALVRRTVLSPSLLYTNPSGKADSIRTLASKNSQRCLESAPSSRSVNTLRCLDFRTASCVVYSPLLVLLLLRSLHLSKTLPRIATIPATSRPTPRSRRHQQQHRVLCRSRRLLSQSRSSFLSTRRRKRSSFASSFASRDIRRGKEEVGEKGTSAKKIKMNSTTTTTASFFFFFFSCGCCLLLFVVVLFARAFVFVFCCGSLRISVNRILGFHKEVKTLNKNERKHRCVVRFASPGQRRRRRRRARRSKYKAERTTTKEQRRLCVLFPKTWRCCRRALSLRYREFTIVVEEVKSVFAMKFSSRILLLRRLLRRRRL